MKLHIFHKWTKWKQYTQRYTRYHILTQKDFETADMRQYRKCEICGKMQDELVSENVIHPNTSESESE